MLVDLKEMEIKRLSEIRSKRKQGFDWEFRYDNAKDREVSGSANIIQNVMAQGGFNFNMNLIKNIEE